MDPRLHTQPIFGSTGDGASNEDMMKSVLEPFKNKGYTVWGDNTFVSVTMLRVCKEWGIKFAGTTRTIFGFPEV